MTAFINLLSNLNPGVTFVSGDPFLAGSARLVNVNLFSFEKERDRHAQAIVPNSNNLNKVIRGGPFDSEEGGETGIF